MKVLERRPVVEYREGPEGEPGPRGPKGERGDPGRDGRDGVNGTNGRDGKDAPKPPATWPFVIHRNEISGVIEEMVLSSIAADVRAVPTRDELGRMNGGVVTRTEL